MARDYLLPRYQSLVQATDKQEQIWTAFCRQPSADGFGSVRSAFQAAMDAWMPLQHVRTGPAALQTRIDRIYFWPERKNAVAKQLAALLQSADAAALAPDRHRHGQRRRPGLPGPAIVALRRRRSRALVPVRQFRRCLSVRLRERGRPQSEGDRRADRGGLDRGGRRDGGGACRDRAANTACRRRRRKRRSRCSRTCSPCSSWSAISSWPCRWG